MDIMYDKSEIDKVLADIYRLIKLPISLFDKDMKLLTTPKIGKMTDYCNFIRANGGTKGCINSDETGCQKCLESGKSMTYRCHAGICETITPLKFENLVIGYIIFGQYRLTDETEEILSYARRNDLDENLLLKHYENLTVLDEDMIDSICRVLQSCILGFYLKNAVSVVRSELSNKIKDYIENSVGEKLTVEKLCAKFFINKKQLYSLFKRNFGKTVKQYLFDTQIAKAKHLLSSSDISVTEVAEKAGFSDYNNFIQRFKKEVGLTPLRYRKSLQSAEKYDKIVKNQPKE